MLTTVDLTFLDVIREPPWQGSVITISLRQAISGRMSQGEEIFLRALIAMASQWRLTQQG